MFAFPYVCPHSRIFDNLSTWPYSLALDYAKTTNYYWSQIDIKDVTGVSAATDGKQGGQPALEKVNGPFGFDEAVQLGEERCLTKSEYKVIEKNPFNIGMGEMISIT